MQSHSEHVMDFYIKNGDHLLELKDKIVKMCDLFNARAYIRLNKRDKKTIALQTLSLLAQNIAAENYDVKNCYTKVCGQYHSDLFKTWVIDFDYDVNDPVQWEEVKIKVTEILKLIAETNREPKVYYVPTKNGKHLICPPFNIAKYKEMFGDLEFHKENPTILYIP